MHKTISTSPQSGSNSYIAKMILKRYNKSGSLGEVGVPQAISHLLKFPDHYTDTTFVNIHMIHIVRHMHGLVQHQDVEDVIIE
jgi:methyltransferase-like protein